jgi:hypothetical protein
LSPNLLFVNPLWNLELVQVHPRHAYGVKSFLSMIVEMLGSPCRMLSKPDANFGQGLRPIFLATLYAIFKMIAFNMEAIE